MDLVNKLKDVVDFSKNIPKNIFYSDDYVFWFFERPLLGCLDLLESLIVKNKEVFDLDLLVSFGYPESSSFAYFLIEGNINLSLPELLLGFRDFFSGTVNYPIGFMNSNFDWIGFESAYEELGVLAVKKHLIKYSSFIHCLNENFITPQYMETLLSSAELGRLAKELLRNYPLV